MAQIPFFGGGFRVAMIILPPPATARRNDKIPQLEQTDDDTIGKVTGEQARYRVGSQSCQTLGMSRDLRQNTMHEANRGTGQFLMNLD